MKVLVCEDIEEEAEELSEMIMKSIRENGDLCTEISVFTCGDEVLQEWERFDLLFLDCRLPDMSGTDLAMQLRALGCKATIIFVSAYNEYATDGYESGAFRYLLKPVDMEKLNDAVCCFIKQQKTDKPIVVNKYGKPIFLKPSEIYFIEAMGSKTIISLKDDIICSDYSLKKFEEMIKKPTFMRSSRQFLVNLQYIETIKENVIYMENGEKVTISRRNHKKFNDLFKLYLTSNYFNQ